MKTLPFVVAICLALPTAVLADEVPGTLRPYEVQIEILWPAVPSLGGDARQRIENELSSLAERTVGRFWRIKFRSEGLMGTTVDRLDRWTPDSLPAGLSDDKYFRIGLDQQGSGWEIGGFEWDTALKSRSRVLRRTLADDSQLADSIWRLVHDVFRPLAEIRRNRAGVPFLESRAGELPPPDPAWTPLEKGTAWEPVNRLLGKDQTMQKLQPIPWTYLSVESVSGTRGAVKVTSGLRSPLGGRRRRVQTLAMRMPAGIDLGGFSGTRLTLRRRGSPPRPVAGLEVRLVRDEKSPPQVFVTDRLGSVSLPAGPVAPAWLEVASGLELLAKVPYVVGQRADEVLDLPDDSIRLKVEGEISLLQADLVDTVARRAVLMATARARSKSGDVDGVKQSLSQLRLLKNPNAFTTMLSGIEVGGTQAAKQARNKSAEIRIRRLCSETSDLIAAYLSPDRVRQLEEEAEELQEVARETKEANEAAAAKKNQPQQADPQPAPKPAASLPLPGDAPKAQPPLPGTVPLPGNTPKPPANAPGF